MGAVLKATEKVIDWPQLCKFLCPRSEDMISSLFPLQNTPALQDNGCHVSARTLLVLGENPMKARPARKSICKS